MSKLPNIARVRDNIVGAMYVGQERLNKQRPNRTPDIPTVRVSSVGDCVRKNWARHVSIPVDEDRELTGRTLSIFEMGNKVEDIVVEELRNAYPPFSVTDEQKEVRFETGEGHLVGHIDGIILYARERMLLEVKSANDNQFSRCVALGYEEWNPKYASQIHCYMAGLGLDQCIVIVYNKNTSARYAEQITFDPSVYRRALADTELILRDNHGQPPERPKDARNKSCAFCKWCDFAEWCWGPLSEVRFDD